MRGDYLFTDDTPTQYESMSNKTTKLSCPRCGGQKLHWSLTVLVDGIGIQLPDGSRETQAYADGNLLDKGDLTCNNCNASFQIEKMEAPQSGEYIIQPTQETQPDSPQE